MSEPYRPGRRKGGSPPHNLPLYLSSFLGRQEELGEVEALLGSQRLVALTGPGGCGKSRLAVRVAATRLNVYPDGVWFCDLGPLQDPALVVSAVAAAVGLSATPGRPLPDLVASHLTAWSALVILDGCEHVLTAAAELVEHLAARCPGVTLLATSREPLGVVGEATCHVPPLGLPADEFDTSADSVALFVERAILARSTFRLTPSNRRPVIDVCRRLDGIPLAIELAAAACRLLDPAEIAEELDRRFSILAGGPRRAIARHRTLEASMEWSYRLLSADEQVLLQRLSVFAGAFDVEAAAAVIGVQDPGAMVTRLSALVDKSLLDVRSGSKNRFRLLDVIRDFAERKLDNGGSSAKTRDRHLRHFTELAERHELVVLGPDLLDWVGVLDRHIDNFRAALDWSDGAGGGDLGYRLGAALSFYWTHRGAAEGHQRVQAILRTPSSSRLARANVLCGAAELAWFVADWESMTAAVDEGLALAEELSDQRLRGRLLLCLGWLRLTTGDASAGDIMAQASELAEACGDEWYAVDAVMGLAHLACTEGRVQEGVEGSGRAAARALAMGNAMLVVRTSFFHALCTSRAGRFAEALHLFAEHAAASSALGEDLTRPVAATEVALIVGLRGDDERATNLLAEAREQASRANVIMALAHAAVVDAVLAYRRGSTHPPLELAETLAGATGTPQEVVWCQATRGMVALQRGDLADAHRACADADRELSEPFTGWARPWALVVRSHLAHAEGEAKQAQELALDALGHIEAGGGSQWLPEALEALAAALSELAAPASAGRCLGAAGSLRGKMGHPVAYPEQPGNQATAADVIAALGPEAAAAAFSQGAEAPLATTLASVRRRRGERKRPPSGWASLTPTEVEVVALVSTGLRNAEVARRLFVAPSTVKTHLTHVFTKLDVSTRAELVALANGRGG